MNVIKLSGLMLLILVFNACSVIKARQEKAATPSLTETFKLNFEVTKETLSNGLKVIVVNRGDLPIFSYYTFYHVGAKYETPGLTGATHYLEHLMFKGAKKYGPGQFDSTVEGNGGWSNAYTTLDNTVYHENMPATALEKIIDLEADRMANLALEPEAFEKERHVILEERRYRYENRPGGQLHLAMMQAVFENTPYGGSVIGDIADLKSVKREQISDYFKKYYAPNNAIVLVVGKVDPEHVISEIKKRYGLIRSSNYIDDLRLKEKQKDKYRHQGRYGRSIALHGTSPTPMFSVAFQGEPLATRRSYVMDILSSVLGDGASSYLVQKWVKGKRPWLVDISAANYTLKENGVFFINGKLLQGKSLGQFKKLLVKDFKVMCEKSINERSIQKTKNQYMIHYFRELETNAGVAQFLGSREFYFGDYQYYKKELEHYASVRKEELLETCREIFQKPNFIFLSVWNKHSKGRRR